MAICLSPFLNFSLEFRCFKNRREICKLKIWSYKAKARKFQKSLKIDTPVNFHKRKKWISWILVYRILIGSGTYPLTGATALLLCSRAFLGLIFETNTNIWAICLVMVLGLSLNILLMKKSKKGKRRSKNLYQYLSRFSKSK